MVREMYKPPALENDGAELNFMNDRNKYYPRNDDLFREMLLKFTMFIETPSKPSQNGHSQKYASFMVSFYRDNFKLIPKKLIEGRNEQGNLDYAIECRSTGRVLGIIEVKKEDFMKGFAQASVQMESTLSRKRKADEIVNDQEIDRVFGIVTDASEWYFMECSLDDEGKPTFKLSKSVTVVYNDEDLQTKVEKVLGHIVWLLEEVQKPDSALDIDKDREIKRPRSTDDLTVKNN
ncbi:hypothetical protein C1645_817677 [Glomus cerebriforme]|uniref:Uncharacterized protein n=1 Tax=Glomus cerebriforme TaxID=658196 RepID=A0A397TI06_9GLOM|nr:hypothetical protein C1645_817677 [Glomus cerebriforme]